MIGPSIEPGHAENMHKRCEVDDIVCTGDPPTCRSPMPRPFPHPLPPPELLVGHRTGFRVSLATFFESSGHDARHPAAWVWCDRRVMDHHTIVSSTTRRTHGQKAMSLMHDPMLGPCNAVAGRKSAALVHAMSFEMRDIVVRETIFAEYHVPLHPCRSG